MRKITLEDVKFKITCETAEVPPEFDLEDKDLIREIRTDLDMAGNEWAWCDVTVTGTFGPLTAEAFIGSCNYDSEYDFRENSGYYDDMKREIVEKLNAQLDELESLLDPTKV